MGTRARWLLAALFAFAAVACSSGTTTPVFTGDGAPDRGVPSSSDQGGPPLDRPLADRGVGVEGAPPVDGPPCGNGVLDPGEACDPQIAAGDPGACVTSCDDGNPCTQDKPTGSAADCSAGCSHAPLPDCCGNGQREGSEVCDDGNTRDSDLCTSKCQLPGGHLLISEVVTRPPAAEFVEIFNPSSAAVPLDDVYLSDRADYYLLATGAIKGVGTDFIARFPAGAVIKPGAFLVVALSGADFATTFGGAADYEVHPTDGTPDMIAPLSNAIGATAGLTDAGELVVLFTWDGGADLVNDIDYLYWGTASSTTEPLCKAVDLCVDGPDADAVVSCFAADTPIAAQSRQDPPDEGGSLHRCNFTEGLERKSAGNGSLGHDETSEDLAATFARNLKTPEDRSPGQGPPPALCWP